VEIIKEQILKKINEVPDKITFIEEIRQLLHELFPINQPVDFVQWIDSSKIEPNDYNPNMVAGREMKLLYKSIKHDGYTQPIVTIYDPDKDKYIIVDGFHRYYVGITQDDIKKTCSGKLPIVVLKKDIKERMAATIRHNRARGEHTVQGMSSLVFKMLKGGMSEVEICDELGMEEEEIIKLKHLTGFSKLFEGTKYKRSWESENQIKLRKLAEKYSEITAQQLNNKLKAGEKP
jgi:hypothetical protein